MPLRFLHHLAAWLFAAALSPALAQDAGPGQLVKQLTDEIMQAIQRDEALRAGDRERAIALAEEKVLPYIDFRAMTRLAVGRPWRQASPEQQDALAREFRALLVRTYANAIKAYRGQTMRVGPVRMEPGGEEATVRNQYLSPGRAPVPVDYRMHKTGEGWKAYDIVVSGVSLVTNYRSMFEQEVERSGIDGLIRRLGDGNIEVPPAPAAAK